MVFCVAEVGSNHCGDIDRAKKLINEALHCGVKAVKFQAFDESIWTDKDEWKKRAHFQVDEKFLTECAAHCQIVGVEFMCTPCYVEAIPWLDPLVQRWKVASADVRNTELIKRLRLTNKQILASTGFLKPQEVWPLAEWAVPLHCVPAYPADAKDYGLRQWLEAAFPFSHMQWSRAWGISDHTKGIGTAVAAVAHGAYYVEKHFALYDQPSSPDSGIHAARPAELRALVQACDDAHRATRGSLVTPHPPLGRKVW